MFADAFQGAILAFRASRGANIASKEHNAVAKVRLKRLFDALIEDFFNLFGRFFTFGVKAESAADAYAVRIGDDIRLPENVTEHKVCNLAAYAGE